MQELIVNFEITAEDGSEKKNQYTPPALTLLLDLSIDHNAGVGADGGYVNFDHS